MNFALSQMFWELRQEERSARFVRIHKRDLLTHVTESSATNLLRFFTYLAILVLFYTCCAFVWDHSCSTGTVLVEDTLGSMQTTCTCSIVLKTCKWTTKLLFYKSWCHPLMSSFFYLLLTFFPPILSSFITNNKQHWYSMPATRDTCAIRVML